MLNPIISQQNKLGGTTQQPPAKVMDFFASIQTANSKRVKAKSNRWQFDF